MPKHLLESYHLAVASRSQLDLSYQKDEITSTQFLILRNYADDLVRDLYKLLFS